MESLITIAALIVVAVVSATAIFHPAFHDTLIQRIGLAGICIGALALAWDIYQTGRASDPVSLCSWFAALYGLETVRKI